MDKSYTETLFNRLFGFFRILGANPTTKWRTTYQIYAFALYFFVNFLHPPTLIIAMLRTNNFDLFIATMPFLMGMVTCNIKFYNTYRQRHNLLKLKDLISLLDRRCKEREEESYLKNQVKIISGLLILFIVDATFISLMMVFSTILSTRRDVLFSAWFPFDWEHSSAIYYAILFYQSAALVIIVWIDCINECYPVIYSFIMAAHLHVLNMRFTRIGYDSKKNREEIYNELVESIVDLNSVIGIIASIEKIISSVCLIQFFVVEALMGMQIIYLSTLEHSILDKAHTLFFLMASSSELFFPCYCGSLIQNESRFLTTAIYSSNWMDQDARFKKTLIVLMIRSQKMIQIRAGGLVEVALPTFFNAIKTAYSFFALLNHFMD